MVFSQYHPSDLSMFHCILLSFPIEDIIGYDLDRGTIEFVGHDGSLATHFLNINFYSSESNNGFDQFAEQCGCS